MFIAFIYVICIGWWLILIADSPKEKLNVEKKYFYSSLVFFFVMITFYGINFYDSISNSKSSTSVLEWFLFPQELTRFAIPIFMISLLASQYFTVQNRRNNSWIKLVGLLCLSVLIGWLL